MGIYISGINLPRGKHSIVEITITEDGTVFTGSTDTFHKSDLRAVEIPTPHGRLIDCERAISELANCDMPAEAEHYGIDEAIAKYLNDEPTVIEAEE